jgi:aminoglycoside 6'-N-acetyltransferase I
MYTKEGVSPVNKHDITIAPITIGDSDAWVRMRRGLWPGDDDGHQKEVQRFLGGERKVTDRVFVAKNTAGEVIGFIELSIRPFAEGCTTDRIAYFEGMYVNPAERGKGVGRMLIHAAEEWGRSMGCREVASDTEISNETSVAVHRAMGFVEVNRIVCFRKDL